MDAKQNLDGKVIWENIDYNIGSGLNVTTGEFKARVENIGFLRDFFKILRIKPPIHKSLSQAKCFYIL